MKMRNKVDWWRDLFPKCRIIHGINGVGEQAVGGIACSLSEKYNENNKEGTFFFLVNQVIVKGELKDTINIEKKKLVPCIRLFICVII